MRKPVLVYRNFNKYLFFRSAEHFPGEGIFCTPKGSTLRCPPFSMVFIVPPGAANCAEGKKNLTERGNAEPILDEKGQAVVEAAIVMPILIFLMLGIFQFGVIIQNRQRCYMSARQGARLKTNDSYNESHLQDFFRGPDNSTSRYRNPAKARPRCSGSKKDATVWVDYSVEALPFMPPIIPGTSELGRDHVFYGAEITNCKCRMIGDVKALF